MKLQFKLGQLTCHNGGCGIAAKPANPNANFYCQPIIIPIITACCAFVAMHINLDAFLF